MSLIDDYLASFRRKADTTKRDRRYILMEFANWLGKPLDQAEPNDVEDWMDGLIGEKGLKPSAVNQYLTIVKGAYRWISSDLPVPIGADELREVLMKQKRFGKIAAIERLEAGETSERAWDEKQLKVLLRASEGEPDEHRIIFLGSYFGLRRDELRLLLMDDVDFRRNEIRIRREITKTSAGVRTIPFHPAVAPYLRSGGEHVIGGKGSYSRSFYYSMWRRYDKVAGFHLRTKQMRSTLDTHLSDSLQKRLPHRRADLILKSILGHKQKAGDMSDVYYGRHQEFEDDRKRAMWLWHPFVSWEIIHG